MNREEAKRLFREDVDSYGKPKSIMHKIDKIYDEFEEELNVYRTELEDGCNRCQDEICSLSPAAEMIRDLEKTKEEFLEFVAALEKREGAYTSSPGYVSRESLWTTCKEILQRYNYVEKEQ